MRMIVLSAILATSLVLSFVARAEESVAFNTSNSKYHRLSCTWAKKCTVNCIVVPLREALSRGGIPCKVCGPPTRETGLKGPTADRLLAKPDDPVVSNRVTVPDRLASADAAISRPSAGGGGGGAIGRSHGATGSVILNGVRVTAWWNDGDSFTPRGRAHGKPVRVAGYNTLETFGAVHLWGTWSATDLLRLSRRATQVAASSVRYCTSLGKQDFYRRDLVKCQDAARDLVEQGLAMVYAVNEMPDQDLLDRQSVAQAKGMGIWAGGVPETIVTSVHSVDENAGKSDAPREGQATAYNRVVNTRTGATFQRQHQETFEICRSVCEGEGKNSSCMTYVPFERRYRDVPDCLR